LRRQAHCRQEQQDDSNPSGATHDFLRGPAALSITSALLYGMRCDVVKLRA